MSAIDNRAPSHSNLHLVCGSGGVRAFLTGAGTILACDAAGITSWETIGGVSGGSIISALYAGGVPAPELVEQVIEFDFSTLFKKTDSIANIIRAHLPRRPKNVGKHALREGLLKSAGLGQIIDEYVPNWPANFWTIAVAGNYHILFTADGVFQIGNGKSVRISDKPAPMGLAIRASCAIPGILESIDYLGRHLFDGALSEYGDCPTGVVRTHFKGASEKIIACDVSGVMTRQKKAIRILGRIISGGITRKMNEHQRAGEIFIAPKLEAFGSLQFSLNRKTKEQAVLSGFRASVEELSKAGILTGEKLELCQKACQSYAEMHRLLIEDRKNK